MRFHHLNCRVPYNIISGDERAAIVHPMKPANPNPTAPMSSRVDTRQSQQPMYNYNGH
jgi:hypothetical protein